VSLSFAPQDVAESDKGKVFAQRHTLYGDSKRLAVIDEGGITRFIDEGRTWRDLPPGDLYLPLLQFLYNEVLEDPWLSRRDPLSRAAVKTRDHVGIEKCPPHWDVKPLDVVIRTRYSDPEKRTKLGPLTEYRLVKYSAASGRPEFVETGMFDKRSREFKLTWAKLDGSEQWFLKALQVDEWVYPVERDAQGILVRTSLSEVDLTTVRLGEAAKPLLVRPSATATTVKVAETRNLDSLASQDAVIDNWTGGDGRVSFLTVISIIAMTAIVVASAYKWMHKQGTAS